MKKYNYIGLESKKIDRVFLLIMALGLFYPLRRRFSHKCFYE